MIKEFQGKYRFLSNFWPSNGKTLEHFYQAAKTTDPLERESILSSATPAQAKRLGKRIKHHRSDWKLVKLQIMEDLVREKFRDLKLASLLLNTGDEELVEGNNWGDTFWGVYNGRGENHLGKILMKIRSEIAER